MPQSKLTIVILIIIFIIIILVISSLFTSSILFFATPEEDPENPDVPDVPDVPTEELPPIEEIYYDEIPTVEEDLTKKIGVKLYDSADYKTLIGEYPVGKYTFGKNDTINDDISSLKVTSGYEVYLYKDSDFKNSIGKTSKDIKDLGKYRNSISSFIVKKK